MEREPRIGAAQEKKLPGFAPQKTLRFVRDAIHDSAHRKIPRNMREGMWARNLNVIDRYLYTQDTLEDIGKSYGFARQNVYLIVQRTIRHLWENSSKSTKQKYPLEELLTRKAVSPLERERRRGVRFKVVRALREGKTTEDIQKELGLSRVQINDARRGLRRLGVEVPFTRKYHLMQDRIIENRELAEELKKSRSDEETQYLLRKVTRGFIRREERQEKPSLALVARVARDAGFHFWSHDAANFAESLERGGLPVGKLTQGERRCFFIAAQYKARAKKVFLKDPNLQRFRESLAVGD